MFQKHVLTKGSLKNPKAYEVCDIDSYTKCCLCKTSVHYFPHKFGQKSQNYFSTFTVITSLGWQEKMCALLKRKNNWKAPIVAMRKQNKIQIRAIKNNEYK